MKATESPRDLLGPSRYGADDHPGALKEIKRATIGPLPPSSAANSTLTIIANALRVADASPKG